MKRIRLRGLWRSAAIVGSLVSFSLATVRIAEGGALPPARELAKGAQVPHSVLAQAPRLAQARQVEMRVREVGRDGECSAVSGGRIVAAIHVFQQHAEIEQQR